MPSRSEVAQRAIHSTRTLLRQLPKSLSQHQQHGINTHQLITYIIVHTSSKFSISVTSLMSPIHHSHHQSTTQIKNSTDLPGHMRRNCPMRSQGNTFTLRSTTKLDKAEVYMKMSLFGKDVPCLVDTGCELTLVPRDLVSCFRNLGLQPSIRRVGAINNTPVRVNGEVQMPFILHDHCLWTTALVLEGVKEVTLGIDWCKEHGCRWNFKTRSLCIDGQRAIKLTHCRRIESRQVFVDKLKQWYTDHPPKSWLTDSDVGIDIDAVPGGDGTSTSGQPSNDTKAVILGTGDVRPSWTM